MLKIHDQELEIIQNYLPKQLSKSQLYIEIDKVIDGDTLYNTRFFVETTECITKKETDEFEKIIKNQQKIIEVLTKKNKVLERELKKYKSQ